jgi:hypothetical protein
MFGILCKPIEYYKIQNKLSSPYYFNIYSKKEERFVEKYKELISSLMEIYRTISGSNDPDDPDNSTKNLRDLCYHFYMKGTLLLFELNKIYNAAREKHLADYEIFKREVKLREIKSIPFNSYLERFEKPQKLNDYDKVEDETTGDYFRRLISELRDFFGEFDSIYGEVVINEPSKKPVDNESPYISIDALMFKIKNYYDALLKLHLTEDDIVEMNYEETIIEIIEQYEKYKKNYEILYEEVLRYERFINSQASTASATPSRKGKFVRTPISQTLTPFQASMRKEAQRENIAKTSVVVRDVQKAASTEAVAPKLEDQSRLKELISFNKQDANHTEAFKSVIQKINKVPPSNPHNNLKKALEDSLRRLIINRVARDKERTASKLTVELKTINLGRGQRETIYEIKLDGKEFCHLSLHTGDDPANSDKPYSGSPIIFVYNKITDIFGKTVAGDYGEWKTRNSGAIHLTLHNSNGSTDIIRTLLLKPVISAFKKTKNGKSVYKYFLQVKLIPNIPSRNSIFTTCELDLKDSNGENIYIGRVVIDTLNIFFQSDEMAIPERFVPPEVKKIAERELKGGRLTRKRTVKKSITKKRIIRKSNKSRNLRKNKKINKTKKLIFI